MNFYEVTLAEKMRNAIDKNRFFSNRYFSLSEIWDGNKRFIVGICLLVIIKTWFFNFNIIPSSSMNPNLLVGDYVLVNKFKWIYSEPEIGDVVTFEVSDAPYMVKRIVATSGDEVSFDGGYLLINRENLKMDYYENKYTSNGEMLLSEHVDFYSVIETNRGATYGVVFPKELPRKLYEKTKHNYFTEAVTVPVGHYYLAGDNRFFSKDSRYYNTIAKENLVGQPMIVLINLRLLKDKLWALLTLDFETFIHGSWDLRFLESID